MGGTDPINHGSMLTKTVLQQKDRCSELEAWNLVLVKADAFKGKRKIKDRWEMRLGRWCIRL